MSIRQSTKKTRVAQFISSLFPLIDVDVDQIYSNDWQVKQQCHKQTTDINIEPLRRSQVRFYSRVLRCKCSPSARDKPNRCPLTRENTLQIFPGSFSQNTAGSSVLLLLMLFASKRRVEAILFFGWKTERCRDVFFV